MNPLQLAFYKGMKGSWGAIQFNLQKPHFYVKKNPRLKNYEGKYIPEEWLKDNPHLTRDDLTSREGCLFLEITSTVGANVYDWENKIIMALSIHEMGKILSVVEGLTNKVEIPHDPGAKTASAGKVMKNLSISSPKGIKEGCMVTVTQKEATKDLTKHTVPLSGDELKTLGSCLRAVIPASLAWV